MDMNSLAHTTWECKYHIVFAPKYRRKVIYKQIRADIGKILSDLCKRKGIEIIAAEACPDHVHMFVRIPPKYSVSEVMGYLKGKSSLMIFERHPDMKIPVRDITKKRDELKAKYSILAMKLPDYKKAADQAYKFQKQIRDAHRERKLKQEERSL